MLRPLRVVGAIGAILRLFSLAFLLPLVVALVYEPYDVALGPFRVPFNALNFALSTAIVFLLGMAMRLIARSVDEQELGEREAYLTVGIGWIVMVAVGMLPFMISGALPSVVDAFFETMSAVTTTGATVIPTMEDVAASVMMWRAVLQFIGGMGIIVLSVAVLARLTQGGMQMLQAEAPGPSVTRIAPRLAQTARILWTVYLLFAGVLFVMLMLALMRHDMTMKQRVFDAVFHTFTSLATGGFSNHTSSIAFYDDWLIEVILIVAMVAGASNFTLHYHLLQGNARRLTKDPEWRFFIGVLGALVVVITTILWYEGGGGVRSLRDAAFTVTSLLTASGFGTADFDRWPQAAKMLLLLAMFTGGTAGSTAGGIKHVRILLLWKVVVREIRRIRHPQAVLPIRLAGSVIKVPTIMATVAFFFAFVAMWLVGTILLVAFDPVFTNVVDASSASIAALSTVGPGFGPVGPTQSYAGLTVLSKVILTVLMWAGRLEIFTALIVFTPATWRH